MKTSADPNEDDRRKTTNEVNMATAMGICADELDGLTSEIISEVEPDEPETEGEPEVLPEGTAEPDEETAHLIADVIKVADEFRPAHTKLKKIIEANRVKIVLLKNKFGVKKGSAGHHLLIGAKGKKTPMLWEGFVIFYFDVTPKRINQLLDVDDEKDGKTIVKPAEHEKPLYKKGYAAAMTEANKRLELLQPSPEDMDMAEQIVQLKEKVDLLTRQTDELGATADGHEQYIHQLEDRLKVAGLNTPDEAPPQRDDETGTAVTGCSEVIAYFGQYKNDPKAFTEELSLLVRHYGLARKIVIDLI